jgi:hypothetical protein
MLLLNQHKLCLLLGPRLPTHHPSSTILLLTSKQPYPQNSVSVDNNIQPLSLLELESHTVCRFVKSCSCCGKSRWLFTDANTLSNAGGSFSLGNNKNLCSLLGIAILTESSRCPSTLLFSSFYNRELLMYRWLVSLYAQKNRLTQKHPWILT